MVENNGSVKILSVINVKRKLFWIIGRELGTVKLADEVLPSYEPDDGLPTDKQMAAIRKAAGPAGRGKVISSLF